MRISTRCLLLLACTGLTACAKPCVTLSSSDLDAYGKVGASSMSTQVTISRLNIRDAASSFEGRAILNNETEETQQLKYRFQWSTMEGYTTGENVPWIPLVLSPYEKRTLKGAAPNHHGISYQLTVCKGDV